MLVVFTAGSIYSQVSETIRAVKPTSEIGHNCP